MVGIQAGATHEGAVHAGLAKQRDGVLRIDAATVLNDKRLSRLFPEHTPKAPPDYGVRLLNLLGGSVVSGACLLYTSFTDFLPS